MWRCTILLKNYIGMYLQNISHWVEGDEYTLYILNQKKN